MVDLNLNLAVQKSGRLAAETLSLLKNSGLSFESAAGRLILPCNDFPLNLLMIRDDDIPSYVSRGASDLGIAGYNVVEETRLSGLGADLTILRRLGFARCRLSFAVPKTFAWNGIRSLQGLRIATSYPYSVESYLRKHDVRAEIIAMSGSVEIAPGIDLANIICDLVSSGATLAANNLVEVETLYQSEAVLVGKSTSPRIDRFLLRIDSALKSQSGEARYEAALC